MRERLEIEPAQSVLHVVQRLVGRSIVEAPPQLQFQQ
jgi:hypothetical protein